jgi:hypothetical protein
MSAHIQAMRGVVRTDVVPMKSIVWCGSRSVVVRANARRYLTRNCFIAIAGGIQNSTDVTVPWPYRQTVGPVQTLDVYTRENFLQSVFRTVLPWA